jgi:hypothetical protein
LGGGGGGGGVNQLGLTPADGGNSFGGGGGAGGGPSNGLTASGGADTGNLGGGSGGTGASTYGPGFGGGGGGGGSGLGGAIFVDSYLNFTLQALPGVPTTFNTSNDTTQAGVHGSGGPGGSDGTDGSALGNSIFLRTGSSLTLRAQDAADVLTLGNQVAFTDDTVFGAGGSNVFVTGNGTVVYNGTTDYQGFVKVDNANFKVNGRIGAAPIAICRNPNVSSQRGTLSGVGTLTGNVFVNSGTIAPDPETTLTLGSLTLNSASPSNNTLGSLVKISIDSNSIPSVVSVTGPATLAGTLQIALDPNAIPKSYRIVTSSAITGTFDTVEFTGATPMYSINYQPTYVEFVFTGFTPPPTPTYQVTATVAGGGGAISPAAVMVAAGQTQTFSVTPAVGYSISSVSGCGGSLSGSTFTTAPISAACSITAAFAVVVTAPPGVAVTAQGKGGGGSMDFLTLGGLLIAVLWRFFRRHLRSGVALLLSLPFVAQAGDFNPWYAGIRLGRAFTNVGSADINNQLNDLGYDVSARIEDSARTAWSAFGGWRESQYFGTQVGYTRLGTVDTAFTGEVLDLQAFLRDADRLQPRSASGFDLNLVGRYPLWKSFEIAAQLGAFAWNADYTVSNTSGDFLKRRDNGFDLAYGAGLEYGFGGGLAVTGGWTRYRVDSASIDFIGAGLQYGWH